MSDSLFCEEAVSVFCQAGWWECVTYFYSPFHLPHRGENLSADAFTSLCEVQPQRRRLCDPCNEEERFFSICSCIFTCHVHPQTALTIYMRCVLNKVCILPSGECCTLLVTAWAKLWEENSCGEYKLILLFQIQHRNHPCTTTSIMTHTKLMSTFQLFIM